MTIANLNPALRLFLSGAVIFAVLAAVAGASSALLQTNPASATDNTFSTANADLQIALPGNNFGSSISGPVVNNMIPGGTPQTFNFDLKNTSSSAINLHLFADLSNFRFLVGASPTPTPTGSGGTELDSDMKVQFSCTNPTTAVTAATPQKNLSTSGSTSWTDSATTGKEQIDETTPITLAQNEVAHCTMTVTLDGANTNSSHTAIFNAVFTGQQIGSPSPTPS